jgi:hypothetical protein
MMGIFEPSNREQQMIFEMLPATKQELIEKIMARGWPERYARSLVWNMKRLALIYTGDQSMIKRV